MSKQLDPKEILELFSQSIHCSQIVVREWADDLGLDEEIMMRMAAPFGGGAFSGNMCGAVCGALMLLGAEYGHFEPGDTEGNENMIAKIGEFKQRFTEANGSLICQEIIGYNLGVPGESERAFASGVIAKKCPNCVNTALEILDDMLG
ncbi:hypothetical protein CXIVA_04810 [Clostridium sp. SY8519]|uniref:C-GCAxxG-C-C family protein n=1 Tax=Clostridium sp. (strain SY8519) TaxID=1042156 RepID=UPI0002171BA1|nr:C-GCAxxG-C-C family protein [Clostridium sp. SY8519]BAK46448.1 hypothetical protein CXIVA_04810 [Clostridium sp. SY8519]